MRFLSLVFGAVIMVIALGATAISILFAYQFGHAQGHSPGMSLAYGLAAGGMDAMKAVLPVIAIGALGAIPTGARRGAWAVFAVFTAMSMMATAGNLAYQKQGRDGDKASAAKRQVEASAKLDRLKDARRALPAFAVTSAEAVDTARASVASAERAAAAECDNGRGSRCRAREDEAKAERGRAADVVAARAQTEKAERLEAQIGEAEAALAAVDVRVVEAHSDPFAASMAAALGVSVAALSTAKEVLWAIAIEACSGFGLMIAFGSLHARRETHYEEVEDDAVDVPETTVDADAPAFGSRSHFWREHGRKSAGERVKFSVAYDAYQEWCGRLGVEAMTKEKFSAGSPWPKRKVGGNVYFVDCTLARVAHASVVVPIRRGG